MDDLPLPPPPPGITMPPPQPSELDTQFSDTPPMPSPPPPHGVDLANESATTTTEPQSDSVEALAAAYESQSALLKHEIAYVMGQMQDPHAVPHLIERLEDVEEDVMVRHEAAEALGAIGDRTALDVLERFVDDDEVVIAESCEVALDLLEWVASKRLDYSE